MPSEFSWQSSFWGPLLGIRELYQPLAKCQQAVIHRRTKSPETYTTKGVFSVFYRISLKVSRVPIRSGAKGGQVFPPGGTLPGQIATTSIVPRRVGVPLTVKGRQSYRGNGGVSVDFSARI